MEQLRQTISTFGDGYEFRNKSLVVAAGANREVPAATQLRGPRTIPLS